MVFILAGGKESNYMGVKNRTIGYSRQRQYAIAKMNHGILGVTGHPLICARPVRRPGSQRPGTDNGSQQAARADAERRVKPTA
jgi:hypothetical protein